MCSVREEGQEGLKGLGRSSQKAGIATKMGKTVGRAGPSGQSGKKL